MLIFFPNFCWRPTDAPNSNSCGPIFPDLQEETVPMELQIKATKSRAVEIVIWATGCAGSRRATMVLWRAGGNQKEGRQQLPIAWSFQVKVRDICIEMDGPQKVRGLVGRCMCHENSVSKEASGIGMLELAEQIGCWRSMVMFSERT